MKGSDFKILVEDCGLTQPEVLDLLEISRQHLYRLFKEDEVKSYYIDRIKKLKTSQSQNVTGDKPIPYYDIDATAGNVTIFDGENIERVKQYITVPAFNDCDMFINVSGNSMYPKYCSGDVIALKKINDLDVIAMGEAYLVVTSEQRLLKYIRKGSDKEHVKLVSEHQDYDEFEIHKNKIIYLYLVKGKITKNAI